MFVLALSWLPCEDDEDNDDDDNDDDDTGVQLSGKVSCVFSL